MAKDKNEKNKKDTKAKKSKKNENLDLFADNASEKENKISSFVSTGQTEQKSQTDDKSTDVDYIKSLYPNATHPEKMTYQKQENIGGEIAQDKPVADIKVNTPTSVEQHAPVQKTVDVDYIKSLYPYATHPEKMTYQKQENIGDEIAQDKPVEDIKVNTSASVEQHTPVQKTADIDYIESLYPYATHPELMTYQKQERLDGGIVPEQKVAVENETTKPAGDEAHIKSLYPNATHPQTMPYEKQDNVDGEITQVATETEKTEPTQTTETTQPTQPVETVKKQVNEIASNFTAGEVVSGTGGQPPLENSVLYSGSNVSRQADGLESTVVNKVGDGMVVTDSVAPASQPTQSQPTETAQVSTNTMATGFTAGEVVSGTGGEAPLENSVLYSGSNVSRLANGLGSVVVNKVGDGMVVTDSVAPASQPTQSQPTETAQVSTNTMATGFTAGEVVSGTGGQPPLENSVLYSGSNVSRLANGMESVVVNKVIDVSQIVDTIPTQPIQPSTAPYGQTASQPVNEQPVAEESETMEYDVLIVGAGPSGLSTAIQIKKQAEIDGKEVSVCVVEKGAEVGSHILSGAVLEPRALNELIPDWEQRGAPLDTPAKKDKFLVLTKNKSIRMPTPPQMNNHGNYIISLGKFVNWLGTVAEEMGVEIYTSTSAAEILKEDGRVVGIKTGAFGIDKDGNQTAQYVEGMELRAKYTVMGEGVRGSLTKQLFEDYELRNDCDPQTFGIGIKELWEIDPEKSNPGEIIHTSGWPMDSKTYGGSFLYHLEGNLVSVGFVIGLDYKNPHLFPYMEFQRFKHHPEIAKHLEGGRRISYGARAINEGGFQSVPKLTFKGGLIVGCSAGFVNVPKIKGTHTAMKSGMVAGLELYRAITSGDTPDELTSYPAELEKSWLWSELKSVRNIRPSFHKFGFYGGLMYAGFTTVLGGREPWTFKNHDDHSGMTHKDKAKKIEYPQPDGVLSFDRLTNVAFSGTAHEANQPVHLQLKDKDIPVSVNLEQYDMPETRFCPAGVYELVENDDGPALQINSQNCVHCKTCDIKDPCQNINWAVPEGGNGPNYQNM